jgi:sugar phosphate permease
VGAANYGYSIFIVPLGDALGASRFEVVLVPSVMRIATGLLSPFVGRALDRGPIRAWMVGGSLLLAAGFALASAATAIWQVCVLYASLIAVGTIAAGPIAASTVVAKWFVRARGRALGIAAVGTSLGGVLLPPAIAAGIAHLGWSSTYLAMAALVPLAIAPVVWLVIRDRPEDLGLAPDGDPDPIASPAPASPAAAPPALLGSGHFLRQRDFWTIVAAYGLSSIGFGGVLYNLVPFAIDRGFEAAAAAFLLSVLTAAGVVGKIAVGMAADRLRPTHAFGIAMAASAAGVAGMVAAGSYAALGVSVAALGFGTGGLYPLLGVLIGSAFGRESFGRVMGLMSPFTMALSLPAAPLAGWVFDHTGSYDPVFRVFPFVFALAGVVVLAVRAPAPARAGA